MTEVALAGLFVLAIAIGYLLGRRELILRPRKTKSNLKNEYLAGLNYLLNEQTEEAIEIFVRALEVSSETIETHIALGHLFCRRGEVDKAIHIYQRLLARPSLSETENARILLELARAYTRAGLLDRAENLLHQVNEIKSNYQNAARFELMLIYEKEKEWQQAFEFAQKVKGHSDKHVRLGHYLCEQADQAIARRDWNLALKKTKYALSCDRQSIRASLLRGYLDFNRGAYRLAIKSLQNIHAQNPRLNFLSFPFLKKSFKKNQNLEGYRQWLAKCHREYPSQDTILEMTLVIGELDSSKKAVKFLVQELQKIPSLNGLLMLVDLHLPTVDFKAKKNLLLLRGLIRDLIRKKSAFTCAHCGFEGQDLYWQCPGCGQWGQFFPEKN